MTDSPSVAPLAAFMKPDETFTVSHDISVTGAQVAVPAGKVCPIDGCGQVGSHSHPAAYDGDMLRIDHVTAEGMTLGIVADDRTLVTTRGTTSHVCDWCHRPVTLAQPPDVDAPFVCHDCRNRRCAYCQAGEPFAWGWVQVEAAGGVGYVCSWQCLGALADARL